MSKNFDNFLYVDYKNDISKMVSTDIQENSPKMIHHHFIFSVKSTALADLEAPQRTQSFFVTWYI